MADVVHAESADEVVNEALTSESPCKESIAPTPDEGSTAVPDTVLSTEEMTVPSGAGEVTPVTDQNAVETVEQKTVPTETEQVIAETVEYIINKVTSTPTPDAAYHDAINPIQSIGAAAAIDDAAPAPTTPDVALCGKKRCRSDAVSDDVTGDTDITDAVPATKKPRRWITPVRAALAFGCVTAVGFAPYVVNNPALGESAASWKDDIADKLPAFGELAATFKDTIVEKLPAFKELAATFKDNIADKLPALGEMAAALKEQIVNKLCSL